MSQKFDDFANWPSLDDLLALDWNQPANAANPPEDNLLLLPDSAPANAPADDSLTVRRNVNSGPKHLLFRLGASVYALPVENVVEVHRPLPVTPLPNIPNWFLGVTSLRGDILAVFDLGAFLGHTGREITARQRMIVVRLPQENIETILMVDYVWELNTFLPTQIQPVAQESAPRAGECGTVSHKGETIHLLALDEILRQSSLHSSQAA